MRVSSNDRVIEETLDARGLQCPLPLLKSRMRLKEMATGQVLHVISTDPHAPIDFKAYCADSSEEYLDTHIVNEDIHMWLRKGE